MKTEELIAHASKLGADLRQEEYVRSASPFRAGKRWRVTRAKDGKTICLADTPRLAHGRFLEALANRRHADELDLA